MTRGVVSLGRELWNHWLDNVRRVARHPLVDPDFPKFTPIAIPMFAAILFGSVAVAVAVADLPSLVDPYVWLFALAVVVTDQAEIRLVPERLLVLNDLFYLVPFVYLPPSASVTLILVSLAADVVLHPRPAVRGLARLSSSAQMRLMGLGGVLLAGWLLGDLPPSEATTLAPAIMVLAGIAGVRFNDYLVFPFTIRLAVGPGFSYREFVRGQASLDRYILALEPPLAVVAAYAFPQAPASVLLLAIPYLAFWRLTKLRPRITQLEEADRLKSEFLSMASHELRTPLTSIQGFASTLQDRWSTLTDEQKLQFVTVIEGQGERLGRLVDDLLTMSRIEAGALHTHARATPLQPLAERTLQNFGDEGVSLDCPPDIEVMADPDHLEQIIINYVSNALKYGSPPIQVEADVDTHWVVLRVRDAGEGVPVEFVPHLFDRFSQASAGSRRSSTGTGLGLSIVRALARAQKGDAWYEPNEPRGSTFVVRLPRGGHGADRRPGTPA